MTSARTLLTTSLLCTTLTLTGCAALADAPAPRAPQPAITAAALPLVPDARTPQVAPELRDAAAGVLARASASPSTTPLTVRTGPGTPRQAKAKIRSAMRLVLQLGQGHRLSRVQVFTGNPAWVHAQVMAAPGIHEGERAAFDRRYRDGELTTGWSYSLRGPNDEQTVAVSLGKAPARDWVRLSARELSVNAYSSWGGSSYDRWPCWAGEGLGYPLAWEATARVTKRTYAQVRDADVTQLREVDWVEFTPGLKASEAWNGTPAEPCFVPPGIGHLQGGVAGEYLLSEFGLAKVMAWAQASYGSSWRQAFVDTFGISLETFYAEVDAALGLQPPV